jgi:hypothetical protein
MTEKSPKLMDKNKFDRMLATNCADKIFTSMKNCKSYLHDPSQRATVEERYSLARSRYIELKLADEEFDHSNSLEADLWRCLIEYELMRREEKGRKFRSTRTRNAIRNEGIVQAVASSVRRGRLTVGKTYLIDNDLPEYSFERIILKHAEFFEDEKVVEKAAISVEYYSDNKQKIFDAQ